LMVTIDVLECEKRPVNAVADHIEVKSVTQVRVAESKESTTRILTDSSHSWNDRILAEQFLY
jgi:NAD+ kinase